MKDTTGNTTAKRLVLMRHAHAVSLDRAEDDWSRPLDNKGLNQARQVGRQLKDLSWIPAHTILSDSLRTRQTWQEIEKVHGKPLSCQLKNELYTVSEDDLFEFIKGELSRASEERSPFLILGHNPGLSNVARDFLGKIIDMPTASAICLVSPPGPWDKVMETPQAWRLEHFLKGDGKN